MLRMLITFVVSIYVIRFLGPEQYGMLGYSMSFSLIFMAIANLGLDSIVIRDFTRMPESRDKLIGTVFAMRLFAGCLVAMISFLLINYIQHDDELIKWLVLVISFGTVFQACDVIDLWFQSQVKSKYAAWIRSGALAFSAVLKGSLVYLEAPLIAFAAAYAVELGVVAFAFCLLWRKLGLFSWHLSFSLAGALLKQGLPLLLSGFAVLAIMHIDKIMLGEMGNLRDVGLYSVASMLSNVFTFLPVIIGSTIAPLLVEKQSQGSDAMKDVLEKTFGLMMLLAIVIILCGAFIAPAAIEFLYGNAFNQSAIIFVIQLLTLPFIFHISIRSRALVIDGAIGYVCLFSYLCLTSNIFLNYILIPEYGGKGAAIASLVSWLLSCSIFPVFFKKTSVYVRMFYFGLPKLIMQLSENLLMKGRSMV